MSMSAQTLTCETCGKTFVAIAGRAKSPVRYCHDCHRAWQNERRREQEEAADLEWQEQKKAEKEVYEKEIEAYSPIDIGEIHPSDNALYIIGNGFDLMHKVPSNYYSFRDSLGKDSALRFALESALIGDDIWADFEESLAHLNLDLMGSRFIVDSWLEDFGFFSDEDAGAAEFYLAVEAAANPISTIANDLQTAFRRWVNKLAVGTRDRPLEGLFTPGGKVLCFNYTEFVEDLYHMEDVVYIHGCRKNKREKLVLGHRPGVSMGSLSESYRKPRTYRQAVVDVAQDSVFSIIAECDDELIKDSQEIIRRNGAFFDGLGQIDQIVVIGHSVSPVDWDYFAKVNESAPNAHWLFGSFGLRDLENIRNLTDSIGLRGFKFFRTDEIRAEPMLESVPKKKDPPKPKVFSSGNLRAIAHGWNLQITQEGATLLEIGLPSTVRNVVFFGEHVLVLLGDWEQSLLLFGRHDGIWGLSGLLTPVKNQSLINARLRHIYVTNDAITFVYNNRVRVYDLSSAKVIKNKQVRDAKSMQYTGEDILQKLTARKRH